MNDKQTLLRMIGGPKQVEILVDVLYTKVLDDDLLSPFFRDIDLERQRAHMVRFLVAALNEDAYPADLIRNAHSQLVRDSGLTDVHFDRVAGHIVSAMQQAQLDSALIEEILDLLGSLRPDVLDR